MRALKVRLYRNLRKNCFSVLNPKTRRVICHTKACKILSPKFIVSQAGRERVLRERRKNVHAFIEGIWFEYEESETREDLGWLLTYEQPLKVTYDPYKFKNFVLVDTKKPVLSARFALCLNGEIFILPHEWDRRVT